MIEGWSVVEAKEEGPASLQSNRWMIGCLKRIQLPMIQNKEKILQIQLSNTESGSRDLFRSHEALALAANESYLAETEEPRTNARFLVREYQ